MKFTDRFIKLPIQVYDKAHKELTGKEECYDSFMKINPLDISTYRPSFDDAAPDTEVTYITTKSGDTTTIYLTLEEFEKLINEHQR